jgi:hypothetical protein
MIAIVQGHLDPDGRHYGHALAAAYADAAVAAGYPVNVIDFARLEFPLFRSRAEFDHGAPPAAIRAAQTSIGRAEPRVIFFPPVAGRDARAVKGILGAGVPAGLCRRSGGRRAGPPRQIAGEERAPRRDEGDAGAALPVVFWRAQPEMFGPN